MSHSAPSDRHPARSDDHQTSRRYAITGYFFIIHARTTMRESESLNTPPKTLLFVYLFSFTSMYLGSRGGISWTEYGPSVFTKPVYPGQRMRPWYFFAARPRASARHENRAKLAEFRGTGGGVGKKRCENETTNNNGDDAMNSCYGLAWALGQEGFFQSFIFYFWIFLLRNSTVQKFYN